MVSDLIKIADFFTRVIKNDSLGKIAHMHLALCDQIGGGALNPLCIELAKA